MSHKKLIKIAEVLLDTSLKLKKGEKVFIENMNADSGEFLNIIHAMCLDRGAKKVHIWWNTDEIQENYMSHATRNQADVALDGVREIVEDCDVYIRIKSGKEVSTNECNHLINYNTKLRPILNLYANSDIRRALFYFPGKSLAKRTGMSRKALLDFIYTACVETDWTKAKEANKSIKSKLEKADKVRILGKRTDLSFRLGEIPVVSAHGRRNMPDGEVFTAPVRTSVNGKILFDLKTYFHGITFNEIELEVKKGKIIKAETDSLRKTKALNSILDSHPQNRYFGEFAIGTNQMITRPTKVTLFDEKMAGTIHMALGTCYSRCPNGNDKATIHWDIIKDMRTKGSEIWLDGEKVYEKGQFIVK